MNTSIISTKDLHKSFRVYKKDPGFAGAIKAIFSRKYETVEAVKAVNIEIQEGELVGFIGPNGAGKTTTLKMLAGLLYPTSGSATVLGHTPWKREPALQKQFSLIMGQKNQLWWDLPPIETFLLHKAIYEISDESYKKTLSKLTELLDVKDILQIPVRKLSLGQRMKCELIAALLHSPKILFLDEPTIGLDVVIQKAMRDFIRTYNQEFGATILLTSHYMQDVKELCKRVIVIDKGQILFDGEMKKIIEKYAVNKIITVEFAKHIAQEKIEKIATIKSYEDNIAVLNVPRKNASEVASSILQTFPVIDVNIEEAPIEAIIRDLFQDYAKA